MPICENIISRILEHRKKRDEERIQSGMKTGIFSHPTREESIQNLKNFGYPAFPSIDFHDTLNLCQNIIKMSEHINEIPISYQDYQMLLMF